MTNEPIIMSEWQWMPAVRPSPQHAVYDQLVWHGMILGAIEAFRETGPFYGNIGTGRAPLDYRYRTGPAGDLDTCRKRVEANVRRALDEGMQSFALAGPDERQVITDKVRMFIGTAIERAPGAGIKYKTDALQSLVDEIVSIRSAPQVRDKSGWLIEMNDPPVYHLLSADYDDQWTGDVSRAVRFAREEDAQAYVDHVGWTTPPVRVVEHMWPALTAPGATTKSDVEDESVPAGLQKVIDDTRANMDRALSKLPKLKVTSDPSPTRSDEDRAAEDEPAENTTIGGITWHSSEEDSGPDVGIIVYLGPNDRLWCGEISRRLFDEHDGSANFDNDGGAFIVRYSPKETALIAKCADMDTGREFVEQVAAWVRSSTNPSEVNEWSPIESAPRDGTPIDARAVSTFRYQPYKPNSDQRRKGILGRWQTIDEYGGWNNCAEPQGEWRPNDGKNLTVGVRR